MNSLVNRKVNIPFDNILWDFDNTVNKRMNML